MALKLVSIPIGNNKDISLRALEEIKNCELLIAEERKPAVYFLKSNNLRKDLEFLNEHSDKEDLDFLVDKCKTLRVCLITDCGTPGFCDPGSDLVKACREEGIAVTSVPGASSLMAFISLLGIRLDKFMFEGFISPKKDERLIKLRELSKSIQPVILMDTPYRLISFVEDITKLMPKSIMYLGLNLTKENEVFLQGEAETVLKELKSLPSDLHKSEFMLMLVNKNSINQPHISGKRSSRSRKRK